MTPCPHHLATDDGLPCTRDAGHAPGCTYEASSGGHLDAEPESEDR